MDTLLPPRFDEQQDRSEEEYRSYGEASGQESMMYDYAESGMGSSRSPQRGAVSASKALRLRRQIEQLQMQNRMMAGMVRSLEETVQSQEAELEERAAVRRQAFDAASAAHHTRVKAKQDATRELHRLREQHTAMKAKCRELKSELSQANEFRWQEARHMRELRESNIALQNEIATYRARLASQQKEVTKLRLRDKRRTHIRHQRLEEVAASLERLSETITPAPPRRASEWVFRTLQKELDQVFRARPVTSPPRPTARGPDGGNVSCSKNNNTSLHGNDSRIAFGLAPSLSHAGTMGHPISAVEAPANKASHPVAEWRQALDSAVRAIVQYAVLVRLEVSEHMTGDDQHQTIQELTEQVRRAQHDKRAAQDLCAVAQRDLETMRTEYLSLMERLNSVDHNSNIDDSDLTGQELQSNDDDGEVEHNVNEPEAVGSATASDSHSEDVQQQQERAEEEAPTDADQTNGTAPTESGMPRQQLPDNVLAVFRRLQEMDSVGARSSSPDHHFEPHADVGDAHLIYAPLTPDAAVLPAGDEEEQRGEGEEGGDYMN